MFSPMRTFPVLLVLANALVARAQPLEGTKPLEAHGDLASQMVDGIDRFLLRETSQSVDARKTFWKRDTSSREQYEASVGDNRARLAKILGVVGPRVKDPSFEYV